MKTEVGCDQKKIKGCNLLSLLFGRHNRSSSKKSIPNRKPATPSSPAKTRPPSSSHPQRRTHLNASQFVLHKSKPAAAPEKRKQVTTPGNGLSGELDMMIYDYQKAKGNSKLVRASSSNVMVYGQLGNIWGKNSGINGGMGNIVRSKAEQKASKPPVLCRALSKRTDPEKLKEMGNEEFNAGRLSEALALYNKAIMLDPEKASYWNNKAAALAGMGRLIEAIKECKEAVRIDPSYSRAHYRLATLYLRLGEAEKAVNHYNQSRKVADTDDISRATNLQMHILRCSEARKLKEWQSMLKESQSAISSGADSAPKVFALQAEALLRLGRHEEADSVLKNAPKFETDAIINFFGSAVNGYILMIQAEVDLASGRFNEAVALVERVDKNQINREISAVVRRVKAVASARSNGNEFFKFSKYSEACTAYGEGLHHDPLNAILLCNRAACHSKLGQWEKAIEDCNTVLNLKPSYAKARLRRADCFAKLEKWEASAQDYQILTREFPADEDVAKALLKAKSHLQRKS
ncbi:hypothetical protein KFK09_020056 [Dendrobium nobile]|uniref:Inactive TPR repeat-containing thioredoxin TTL3-like n=1 Tax=Dendrobium nobile TaxID=94219 RepID=A0A8T3ASX7_DENNO|nr:hypothetical protein KFK09_020056 [Dendrobium nobile]